MRGWLLVMTVLLTGCQTLTEKAPASPPDQAGTESADTSLTVPAVIAKQPVRGAMLSQTPTGSLFNPRYSNLMVSDRRAYRLGDILTVELTGSTVISMGGGSSIQKDNAIQIPDPTILGQASASLLPGNSSLAFDLKPSRKYGGTTSASRKNSLSGNVAVKVVEVLANGSLRIEGDKWLTINASRERIRISGLVRPEDVRTDNTVLSDRLAEVRVDYVAMGINADAHEPGWLTRMLNSSWFPF